MVQVAQNLSIPPHALPPAIDTERLDEATGGDAEFGVEIIATFLEDTVARIEGLALAIQRMDLSVIASEAHTIKGSSANVGAPRMRDLAARVETAARRGDATHLASDIAKLGAEIQRIRAAT